MATGAHSAQAVIMRPSTGEVLAMANVRRQPDGTVANSADNAAVTALFEPGSTQKVFTIAAAIEEGQVRPDTQIDVPSQLQLYDRTFTDSHPHPEAMWSVTDILVNSSNIGTIEIARDLGRTKVDRYFRKFGFGTTTGLGFPAEENGIMKRPDQWSGVDIGTMPIGQGISVTALQLLAGYNVIANDGMYVAPKLVAGTDGGAGQVPSEPARSRRVVSARTAAAMRAMMAKVVTDGTGKLAAVPGYVAAGKTGTARIAQGKSSKDGYLDEQGIYHYRSSFVGLIDGADLSLVVTLEDPKTSIFGGDVAAPVFSHLAAAALHRYEIPPPALVASSTHAVPELSASAKEAAQEDVSSGTAAAAG
ncbi:MAG: penicillin-binding transpeptidase domain-containing protein [Acidimicrobiales bacterium]